MRRLLAQFVVISIVIAVCVGFTFDISAQSQTERPPRAPTMDLRLLVINFDPYLPTRNNVRMGEYMGSAPVMENINDLVQRLYRASHGIINYYHIEYINVNEFTRNRNGFQLDPLLFPDIWDEATTQWNWWGHPLIEQINEQSGDWGFDYDYFIERFDLVGRRNRGEIDEVWFVAEFMHGFETVMVGRGAYWINGTPVEADCEPFRINQIARHRFDTPLENLAHSAENIMRRLFTNGRIESLPGGSPPVPENEMTLWDRFTALDSVYPGRAGVGNAHWAPNSRADYDWGNMTYAPSGWSDWVNNFPNLTGEQMRVNRNTWYTGACLNRDFQTWWFTAFPHVQGRDAHGFSNNWWLYFQTFVYTTSLEIRVNRPASGTGLMIDGVEYLDIHVFATLSNRSTIDVTFDSTIDTSVNHLGEVSVTAWRDGRNTRAILTAQQEIVPPQQPTPTPATTVIRFVIGSSVYTVNSVSRASDVAPFIELNRTMIPLRVVAEALGAKVDWDAENRAALIYTSGGLIQLPVSVPLPDGMGTPVIRDNRTFVPLRYVAETLGAEVDWDDANQAAYVFQQVPISPPDGGGADRSPIYISDGHRYQVINIGMTWYDARAYAERLGGHLVTITSQAEQDFVRQIVNTHGTQNAYWMGGYWTGGVANPATDFRWVTGESATFSAWAPGVPDQGGTAQLAMSFVRRGHPGWGWENRWDDLLRYPDTENPDYTFNIRNLGFIVEWSAP